ncbi:hypothetical protein [Pseudoclavibacter sp. 13-3]|uniref:hypothetical protein n=1 Tax=Pseudoclavibacter sp. 13-3 TaxID=2901228 RepID=UPI001E36B746|nr:hypothetical protein [Pseudoclavibacter sp. 13-3]MCD7100474.1 hypothetical protein [Pseudoclavibacter sp. 13-3]
MIDGWGAITVALPYFFSIAAFLFALRADRRAKEKVALETETEWSVELTTGDDAGYAELLFWCRGPRVIEEAWFVIERMISPLNRPHIIAAHQAFHLLDGENIALWLDTLDDVIALPDHVTIEWTYQTTKSSRALRRIRYLTVQQRRIDAIHYANVSLTDVKKQIHALRESQSSH